MNELLRRYVQTRSEAAFQELVSQNIDLVYSSALRQVKGDVPTAQDVTQAVFMQLAHNAPRLTQHTSLSGWLYTSTRNLAAKTRRTEQRRHSREQEAYEMNQILQSTELDTIWQELHPILDDAMHDLSASDRDAILMRYFEQLPLLEMGTRLKLKESAVHMRIERAIGRLRAALAKRGVTSTAAALTAVMAGRAVGSAPAFLATQVCGKALASAVASGGISWALLKFAGTLKGSAVVATVAAMVMMGLIFVPRLLTTETSSPEKADMTSATNPSPSATVEVPAEADSTLPVAAAIPEVTTSVQGELSFKGKPLSAWLKQLNDGRANQTYVLAPWSIQRTPEQEEAAEAIQSIGSRALPYLVYLLTNTNPSAVYGNTGTDGKTGNGQSLNENRWAAALAFDALGSKAKPAVPVLARALNNIGDWPKPKESGASTADQQDFQTISDIDWHLTKDLPIALASVQPQGWGALKDALSSTNKRTRHFAAWAIGTHHAVVPGTIEALMHVANNDADEDDDWAVFALGEIRQRPEDVVPLLINVLGSTNSNPHMASAYDSLRMSAAYALGKFAPQAASAVPLLSKILADQQANASKSPHIRGALTLSDAVTNALNAITNDSPNVDPEQ